MEQKTKNLEEYNKKCLKIVQKYIDIKIDQDEKSISSFLDDCHFMTQAYYEDIIEERSCTDICGYVLCNNKLSLTSKKQFRIGQKYHIYKNKVYDISRRKNFCSNNCFDCSEYLRLQISTEPLFMRKTIELSNNLKLLKPDKIDSDKFGDVIPLKNDVESERQPLNKTSNNKNQINLTKQSIRRNILRNEKLIENKLSAPYLQEKEFNEIKEKFENFTIKEHQHSVNEESERINNNFKNSLDCNDHNIVERLFGKDAIDVSVEDEQKKLERYLSEYQRLCAKLNAEELEDEKYDQKILNNKKEKKNQKS